MRTSFAGAVADIAPVMTHVHISENDRGTPGSGNVAWDEVFSSIAKTGYDGWYCIEAFSRDSLDFANAINVWREFNPRMDICRDGFAFTKAMIEKHKN
jgi:D-psicose/D-tagatose/L-ribulose 3-epimerase